MDKKQLISELKISDLSKPLDKCAEAIGLDNLLTLSEAVGGERLNIPKSDNLLKAVRKRKIIEKYKQGGYTIEALAIEAGLSSKTVWSYIKNDKST